MKFNNYINKGYVTIVDKIVANGRNAAKNIWKEFIFGGHLMALGAACVVAMCGVVFGIKVGWELLIASYLLFYPIYLYDYAGGVEDDKLTNSARANYLSGNKNIYGVIIGSTIIFTTIFAMGNMETMVLGLVVLALGLMYSCYFKKLTKKIVGFKNYFVSGVWGLMVFLPFFYYEVPVNMAVVILAGFVFVRMVSIQILFDVRDTEGDRKNGLKTIPVVLGNHREIGLLKVINVVTFGIVGMAVYFDVLPVITVGLLPVLFYVHGYIGEVKRDMGNYANYLLGAAEPIVWTLSVFLFTL